MDYSLRHQAHYDASSSSPGPLASILPAGTTAYITVPCLFDGEPTGLIVLGSTSRHHQFESNDRDFAANVGNVLVGSLLRRRLLEADKVKLAFLSQISHELRTPLFGIGSNLELIKEVADPEALASINPLLARTDVCVTSLREILDSVLSFSVQTRPFGRLCRSSQPSLDAASSPALAVADLENLVVEVVKSCWTHSRVRREALHGPHGMKEQDVDIILEFDMPKGTEVMVDVGAMKRVLINLVGNALKYVSSPTLPWPVTPASKIVIAVSCPTLSSASSVAEVNIDIADTGNGMSTEFLCDHLFLPFAQEDPFREGNGLGTAIDDSLLRAMNGTLRYSSAINVGTTASTMVPLNVTIPAFSVIPFLFPGLTPVGLDKVIPSPAPRRPRVQRRVLSDELATLLAPLSPPSSARPSPPTLHVSLPTPTKSDATKLALPLKGVQPLTTPSTPTPVKRNAYFLPVPTISTIARRVLTTYFTSRKIPYVEAEDGSQAVELHRLHRPTYVATDVQMPVMDGLEATERIREIEVENGWAKARIVALWPVCRPRPARSMSRTRSNRKSPLLDLGDKVDLPNLVVVIAGSLAKQVRLAQATLCRYRSSSRGLDRQIAFHTCCSPAATHSAYRYSFT
ncbi:hypothetical protein JCM11641_005672 [Rhodosporidiobolus odoratus]